ncbi:uncharacterized protein Z520_05365 [Fonsecaea multimorphosa CBS 102226]|uniref:Uncharacterized protein n=1 Tax=Fonsecaea multimorphosa CBS 102226 TaxID=1442371 RepID=A0A0D2K724_9EURO|nr:uncharacterized protein Z520_05365 [Fonsecaea multimorphosa CBS 102226]KIX98904.1 hypothetical protein Z520_05365 [Fonsecaea multimorphosa CBS 102226]OAL25180.1 hypothetical protein AYO22_05057 [Fonsecaea multimorphosa]
MASTSPPPPRRFNPEPVETAVRSSRSARNQSDHPSSTPPTNQSSLNPADLMPPPQTKPRRFSPQPVEETFRSSRKKNIADGLEDSTTANRVGGGGPTNESNINVVSSSNDPASLPGVHSSGASARPRRFAPEPVETSARSSRRKFTPEPVETSARSSKDRDNTQEEEKTPKPRRRFAPEPVETTARSSKEKKPRDAEETSSSRPRRKFAPEPIETSTTTRRRRDPGPEDLDDEPPKTGDSTTSSRASSGPRKFSPELIETAKGSYRRVHLPTPESRPSPPPSQREPSPCPEEEPEDVSGVGESRFSAAALARKNPEALRQHSFAVPDLPIIESATSEDEGSETPSLSDSPSSVESLVKRAPPSAKDSYTEYVLRLAAETVSEKELEEQAMAAYINERPHEPVDHFAISREDEEDGPLPVPMFQGEKGADARTFRRSSAAELNLEMENMRKHHQQLEAAKRELKADTAGQSRFSAAALATRHALESKGLKKTKKPRAEEEDSELARMRAAASPPMLGSDLVFPFTISPKMTRCDPDQPPRPRSAESDDESTEPTSPDLWRPHKKHENNAGEGLWMGMCQAGLWQPQSPQNGLRSGIQTPSPATPARERNNPFEASTPGRGYQTPGRRQQHFSGLGFLPLTPPRSQDGDDPFTSTIDKKLRIEEQIEDEFPNRVITQIYNYLSLGYPSLAHMFDEELSKISRIPIEELRKDDNNVDAKGYVGAPEGDGWDEAEVIGKCKRWEALRLYVREWARQSPNFADGRRRACLGADEDWGARVRKGSWAH